MTLIQVDLTKDIDKKISIYKLFSKKETKSEAINELLELFFNSNPSFLNDLLNGKTNGVIKNGNTRSGRK